MEAEWLRYSCQMALPGFSEASQMKLQQAKVLIVGAGGLGCPASQYLAAAGIGTLGIADFDSVSTSNLHRQILYTPDEVGLKKAEVACTKLQRQNPFIKLVAHDIMVTSHNVMALIKDYDIIVDGTDNFETKYLLNDACVLSGKPLVYGAVYQYEAQIAVFNAPIEDGSRTPNFRDLFPEASSALFPGCAEAGVLPTVTGITGCLQANEVIKYITQMSGLLSGRLMILDARSMASSIIKTGRVSKTTITALPEAASNFQISASDLRTGMKENRYELIDVRRTDERNIFHIGGRHIPVDEIENTSFEWTGARPLVFYCASGKRSAEAVNLLKKKLPGRNAYSLAGGLQGWEGLSG